MTTFSVSQYRLPAWQKQETAGVEFKEETEENP